MKALVISSSPRPDGNSALLAQKVAEGLQSDGQDVKFLTADQILNAFLGDCRTCRRQDGECSVGDGYSEMFFDHFLPANGLIVATPVYWYGMSAQLKAFFDRMFCYVATSHPRSSEVIAKMQRKRIGLVLSSEETFPTVSHAIVHQLQEYSRYTSSTFVGVVHGYGNSRGDVARDPDRPIEAALEFGRQFFQTHTSDYRIDTDRPARMWN